MRPLIVPTDPALTPEELAAALRQERGLMVLRSRFFDSPQARYSLVVVNPFLVLRSFGSRCELHRGEEVHTQFGNPWRLLDSLMSRYELLDELDFPLPLGGCFGYWGYELKNFVEPKLGRRALNDLELPECQAGFYDSLVVFDHRLGRNWIIATGLNPDGSRSLARAQEQRGFWERTIAALKQGSRRGTEGPMEAECDLDRQGPAAAGHGVATEEAAGLQVCSNLSREQFIARVEQAKNYIRKGDIYQVNLSHRLTAPCVGGWEFLETLSAVSPAPFAAYLDGGGFQLISSSPELFLRMSGSHIQTRPIKGTRPRSSDSVRDAQLTYELQSSTKELAELVMITDLLRNDLGKVCEFGSVQVPELVRLERYSQVQHLVSTVEGRLTPGLSHLGAFASAFPGGSITGAPKFRAMEIIDELEPLTRGPYTGALGYLGFNRESQLSILIRTAICREGRACFHVGAGIVADSIPKAEYEETLAKAGGFFEALRRRPLNRGERRASDRLRSSHP